MTVNDSLSIESIFKRQLRFYLTNPTPCPYLPDRVERKVFTNLAVKDADRLHDALSQNGFRRSQTIAYRPACVSCAACQSVRVRAQEFKPTKSQRRILNRNKNLVRTPQKPIATREQYRLLMAYLDQRHKGGGMSEMTLSDYSAMTQESPVQTVIYEYREGDENGPLIATAVTDVLRDGLSMVYTFFDPAYDRESLGSFLILDHIVQAQELGIPYVYLGYWVKNSQKMDYKSRFQPLDILHGSEWTAFEKMGDGDDNGKST